MFIKKLLLLLGICTIISSGAFSQIVYLADTAFITDIGFGGAEASCKAAHVVYNGWSMGRAQEAWVADAFTIPAGDTWKFDTVIVYGYQYGSTTTSSFLNCNLQIYSGTPGLGGTVIWGDTSTNVLVSTGWTGIYKVDTFAADNGLDNVYRPIMYLKLYLATPPVLGAGTYWLSWSSAGSLSNGPVAPDKVLPGRINPPGQVGRASYYGVWDYMTDSTQINGMDMIIKASAATVKSLDAQVINDQPTGDLSQNAPNPFHGFTNISFSLSQAGYTKLSVYNTIGQLVTTLIDGDINAGAHQVTFNANNLPAGVYYYQLTTNSGTESKQMLLVK